MRRLPSRHLRVAHSVRVTPVTDPPPPPADPTPLSPRWSAHLKSWWDGTGWFRLSALVLTSLLGAGCGGATISGGYGLVSAEYQDCLAPGTAIAQYLDTGQPTSDDATYGGQRQQVLTLEGDARALYIRRTADAYIQQCDQQEMLNDQAAAAAAAASQAAAEQAAAASQAAAEQAAALQAAEQTFMGTCRQLGGTVDESTAEQTGPNGWSCSIQYPQWSEGTHGPAGSTKGTFYVPIDANGNLADDQQAQQFCANWKSQGNGNWWHPDTQICAVP